MNRTRTLSPLLVLALFCAPAAAQPAPPGPPTTESSPTVVDLDAVEARKAFEEGVVAYQHGDYESAAERFGRAQLLKPHPEVLLNLAQSQLKARKFAEAATNFQSYLTQTQRENATARSGLADAKTQVAEISVVAAEGETVYVDQTAMGTAPLSQPLYLVPGRHEFVVGERRQTLTVSAGTTDTVDLVSPPALAAPPADLSETVPPRHQRMPVEEWFVRRPGAWVGAGITASSLVFSAVSATTAGRRYAAANDAKRQIWDYYAQDGSPGASPCGDPRPSQVYEGPCNYYLDRVESGDSWRTASIVTLLIGVVAASGTVAYYFLDPENRVGSEASSPTLDIHADPQTGLYSVGLIGRF